MNIYVPARGNPNAKIVLLGEAPSYEEEAALAPFVGTAGRELDRLLKDAGISRGECWISNVSKYMIAPQARKGKKKLFSVRASEAGVNLNEQLEELRIELQQIKPNVIVALGGTALWALTGSSKIENYRGSILLAWGWKTIPTYHPMHLLYQEEDSKGYWKRQVVIFDLKRAKAQSNFPEVRRSSRLVHICKNSAHLQQFIGDHLSNNPDPRVAEDIEALHCIPVCNALAFNAREAMSIPLWNRTPLLTISEIPTNDLVQCWITLAKLNRNPKVKKIGQNFKYDEDKLTKLGLGLDSLYSDTLLKAFAIAPELPKKLAFLTSVYTDQPYYKDEGSEFDYTKHPISRLLNYNGIDAMVTWEIDDKQEAELHEIGQWKFYYNFIMKLHKLYMEIENTGFRIDEEKRIELLKKYVKWHERLRYELYKLVGEDINANSWQQVSKLLYDKLALPTRTGTNEEALTQLLNTAAKRDIQRDSITNILDQRRVKKTIGTYLLAPQDFDGRMRTTYYLCLETGRTATGLQEPPVRPRIEVPELEFIGKESKKKKELGMAFQTITKHGDIGNDVREMFVPDEGCIFLQADSAQAEARVVFMLANDMQALEDIDKRDYHALTASWFVGGTENDWSKKVLGYEHPNRFLGKTLRHAGHLGAKARRAATEVNTQARKYHIPITISEGAAKKALETFHAKQPSIQKIFHASIIKQLEANRTLIAPAPYGIDSPVGGRRMFFERWSDELFRQAFSYIPQRTVSDNTKAAALRIKARAAWIKIIVEAHDALLVMVPFVRRFEAKAILKEEMERPIDFSTCSIKRGILTIPCDVEIGSDYCNLSKFKDVAA